jgi:uncharacterized protein YdbL (DUF1318 family)
MTKSLSENKRPYSVMPMRAFADRKLKEREFRVLGALCAFVNRAGVCWPSLDTLCSVSGYAERKSILEAMKRLKAGNYVRQLNPKDYQETASGWKTNRYQVLWKGDEPLPTYEDIHTAKALQLRTDQEDDTSKEIGGLGDAQSVGDAHAGELCHAYLRAVQQATGQVRLYDNEIAHARRLALRDVSADDVRAATLAVCDQAIERRAGVPALADIVRYFDVQENKG